jgi:3' terminal RNA ribose 2'-O-methyltransferase Hen1
MFLSVATTTRPATDLGYLLHKNPQRSHEVTLGFGRAVMVYPEAGEARCEFALILAVDPVALVRGQSGLQADYVSDRPYAASSFLSVALARAVREAMAGRSRDRQALADTAIPLEAVVAPLPVRGGPELVAALFEPLGYEIEVITHPLDPAQPEWGPAPYVTLRLTATRRLCELLTHLYVLMPVLDERKHYFIDEDEVTKLLARGEGWLPGHPQRDLIVARYLGRRKALVGDALARLLAADGPAGPAVPEPSAHGDAEAALERPLRLHDRRLDRVCELIVAAGAKRVLDLGCGSGKLLARLIRQRGLERIVGVEVSGVELARARRHFARLPEAARRRLELLQGSLIYRDERLRGYDAAALVEVIEHLEPDRLPHLERALFGDARPGLVVVTTPNREHNALFPGLAPGALRHPDHRFEWTRQEFRGWAETVAAAHGYAVRLEGVGEEHPELGPPSQLAAFTR